MKINFIYTIVGFFMVLVTGGLIVRVMQKSGPGEYDEFAQCLTENGAVMYGEDWCSNCQAQKRMFGKSFEYIDYAECGLTPERCAGQMIEGYPTWKNHSSMTPVLVGKGVQPLATLATAFSCTLPEKK